MSLAGAIIKKDISIGELVTHSNAMRITSFADLVKVVSNVSGRQDFLEELAKVQPDHFGFPKGKFVISNPHSTWVHLGKVFGVRHILCHELAPDIALDRDETRLLLLASQDFIKASAIWFDKLQNPHPRPTFEQRVASAEERRNNALSKLNSLLDEVKAVSKVELVSQKFREALEHTSRDVEGLLSSLSSLYSESAVLRDKQGRMLETYSHNNLLSNVIEQLTSALTEVEQEIRRRIQMESRFRELDLNLAKRRRRKKL